MFLLTTERQSPATRRRRKNGVRATLRPSCVTYRAAHTFARNFPLQKRLCTTSERKRPRIASTRTGVHHEPMLCAVVQPAR